MADVTYTGQIVREAPEIEAYKLGLLEEAKKLTGQTLTLPAIQAAGLSNLQQQAASLGQQGIGAYVPYIQSGSQAITGASAAQQAALSGLPGAMAPGQALIGTGATATYNPATAAQAYMNPYTQEVVDAIAATKARGGRIIAVGTTSVRSLESAAQDALKKGTELVPFFGDTEIFIFPGYEYQLVDCLITNFHLPESTLIMLVSAFAGYDNVMGAYDHAVKSEYRFFSYGDAMFINKKTS